MIIERSEEQLELYEKSEDHRVYDALILANLVLMPVDNDVSKIVWWFIDQAEKEDYLGLVAVTAQVERIGRIFTFL